MSHDEHVTLAEALGDDVLLEAIAACPECQLREGIADLSVVLDLDTRCLTPAGLWLLATARLPGDLARVATEHAQRCTRCRAALWSREATDRRSIRVTVIVGALAVLVALGALWLTQPTSVGFVGTAYAATYAADNRILYAQLEPTSELLGIWAIEDSGPPATGTRLAVIDLVRVLRSVTNTPGLRRTQLDLTLYEPGHWEDRVQIADIDGDADPELLFSVTSQEEPNVSGWLLCFSLKGQLKWSYQLGGEYAANGKRVDHHFVDGTLRIADLDGDGVPELITKASHRYGGETQVVVLRTSVQGIALVGELWNLGNLRVLTPAELDSTPGAEVLFAGTNNAYGEALLGVLDIARFDEQHCAVPLDMPQSLGGIPLTDCGLQQLVRLPNLFGMRALREARGTGNRGDVAHLQVLRDDRVLKVQSDASVFDGRWTGVEAAIFELGFDLSFTSVQFFDNYRNRRVFGTEGWLAKSLDEERAAMKELKYWDGGTWTSSVTAVAE